VDGIGFGCVPTLVGIRNRHFRIGVGLVTTLMGKELPLPVSNEWNWNQIFG